MDVSNKIIEQLDMVGNDLEGEISFPVLGDKVLFTLGLSGSGIVELSHKKSINWLYRNISEMYPSIEKAIYKYYLSVLPDYHLGLGKCADELMPNLKSSAEVWNHVTEPGVIIFPEEEGGELHLEYECSFDVEHGMRVIFKDEKLIKVGLD